MNGVWGWLLAYQQWIGGLGVGAAIGFALGRWANRRENAGAPTWHGVPQSVVGGVRTYMTVIYLLVALGLGVAIIQAVFFPAAPSATDKDPSRYPGQAVP
jgi:hypothetical protein